MGAWQVRAHAFPVSAHDGGTGDLLHRDAVRDAPTRQGAAHPQALSKQGWGGRCVVRT